MNRKKLSQFTVGILLITLLQQLQNATAFRPFFHGRRRGGRIGDPSSNSNLLNTTPKISDNWIPQKLDNFDTSNNATWMNVSQIEINAIWLYRYNFPSSLQRYYVNDQFYKRDGPIFLMFSGESPASKSFMLYGAWINYANTFGALCLQLEHRFYGKSYPTKYV